MLGFLATRMYLTSATLYVRSHGFMVSNKLSQLPQIETRLLGCTDRACHKVISNHTHPSCHQKCPSSQSVAPNRGSTLLNLSPRVGVYHCFSCYYSAATRPPMRPARIAIPAFPRAPSAMPRDSGARYFAKSETVTTHLGREGWDGRIPCFDKRAAIPLARFEVSLIRAAICCLRWRGCWLQTRWNCPPIPRNCESRDWELDRHLFSSCGCWLAGKPHLHKYSQRLRRLDVGSLLLPKASRWRSYRAARS